MSGRVLEYCRARWKANAAGSAMRLVVLLTTFASTGISHAEKATSNILASVSFEQNLNAQVPLATTFRDANGAEINFGDCLGGKPTVLILGYNRCPMLCSLVLNGFVESLHSMKLEVGREFNVISLSINPDETPQIAAARKRFYLENYGRSEAEHGWCFLTGDETSIRQVSNTVGFQFAYDPVSGEYAHPSGIVVLTPEGRVSRYFFGIQFPPKELRQALEEAGEQKISSPVRRLLLLCFHYDPENSRYGRLVTNSLRAGGALTLFGLGFGLVKMLRRERQRPKGTA
jgi:protein SCO1/2